MTETSWIVCKLRTKFFFRI